MLKIIRDTREQKGWELKGYEVVSRKLDAGDYQIDGSKLLCIERKGEVGEFWKNLTSRKKCFIKEMELMREFDRRLIVCEFTIDELMCQPHFIQRKISPFFILKSVWEIYLEYNVPTLFLGKRAETYVRSLIKRCVEYEEKT